VTQTDFRLVTRMEIHWLMVIMTETHLAINSDFHSVTQTETRKPMDSDLATLMVIRSVIRLLKVTNLDFLTGFRLAILTDSQMHSDLTKDFRWAILMEILMHSD